MESFAANAAAALVAAIWQGSLLAVGVWLCLRMLPAVGAAVRSAIWLAVFGVVFALGFLPGGSGAVGVAGHGVHAAPVWSFAIVVVWGVLSLYRLVQVGIGLVRLTEVRRSALPIERRFVGMEGSRRFELCTSAEVDRPSVVGLWRPRILLPEGLIESLTAAELRQVLLHETEHLRRSDDWTNLLQKLALVVFPLNPVLLWVERRLCRERELACDDRVLADAGGRKAYAECLARLAEHALVRRGVGLALALGAWGRRRELVARVERLLARPEANLSAGKARLAMGGLMLGLVASSVGLARSPRLISFEGSHAEAVETATFAPVSVARESAPTAAPVLVKARMPERRGVPRVRAVRAVARPAVRRPRMVLTAMDAVSDESVRILPTRHFYVPAVAYVPAAYAVVQMPDGWLIFQL